MGRFVDLNQRLSKEDRDYLKSRGRGYLIPANERRFGTDEKPREPEAHETSGNQPQSVFYQSADREAAVYDTGGAPLPNSTLDYNTGRAFDRESGVTVEPRLAGHTPGAHPSPWEDPNAGFNVSTDEDEIDDDIVELVQRVSNKSELKKRLDEKGVEYASDASREDLEDALAIRLQDERDGKVEVQESESEDHESEDHESEG